MIKHIFENRFIHLTYHPYSLCFLPSIDLFLHPYSYHSLTFSFLVFSFEIKLRMNIKNFEKKEKKENS